MGLRPLEDGAKGGFDIRILLLDTSQEAGRFTPAQEVPGITEVSLF